MCSLMINPKRRRMGHPYGEVHKQVDMLPQDMVCEILSRLPIESIMRCRSVCKTWYGLTQDPYFINLQLNRANNQPPRFMLQSQYRVDVKRLLLLDIEEHKIRKIPFEKMQLPAHFRFHLPALQILCSCNGLLCISSKNKPDPVIICNPVTKECLILPLSGLQEPFRGHQIGFGVDPLSGQYKVVRAYRTDNRYFISGFQIITLGESSWRQLKKPGIALEGEWGAVACWNGALHWIIKDRNRRSYKMILAFDLKDEEFYTISFRIRQKFMYGHYAFRGWFTEHGCELLVSGGRLILVEHEVHLMNIWEISGNRVEGFSVSFEHTYDTYVQWNKYLNYATVLHSELKSFLLLVRSTNREGIKRNWFVRFFPEMAQYSYQDITGLPDHFGIIHFKPSLVSPIAASLVSKSASSLKELLRSISSEWRTWGGYAVLKPELLEQLRLVSGKWRWACT